VSRTLTVADKSQVPEKIGAEISVSNFEEKLAITKQFVSDDNETEEYSGCLIEIIAEN
jgi:hypothetical protein